MAKKKKVTTTVTTTVTEEIVSSNEKTQIICILDRSGSMADKNIIVEAISGFNNFLDEQKKLKDKATLTVALFDDRYDLLYDDVDIQKVEKITKDTWSPRGMTALFDAIGKTITTVRANRAKLGSEKPDKVLVCIVTDGLENASQEYTKSGISKLIKECESEDWNFVYLAANQNAFAVGTSFGISAGNTYTFDASAAGAQNMSMTLNSVGVSYRSMSRSDDDYAKKSKNLINPDDEKDDKNEPENSGTITTNGTSGNFTVNN
jgi:uncharacterized protein YegL